LNKLFLPKLPYHVPEDPYIELISQGYEKKELYKVFYQPMMLMKLEQGLGRLIRSKNDFGIITIFDSRVHSKPEVKTFIEHLGYKITSDISEVKKFSDTTIRTKKNINSIAYDKKKLDLPIITIHSKKSVTVGKMGIIHANHNSTKSDDENELQQWLRKFVADHKKDTTFSNPRIIYKNQTTPVKVCQAAINFCQKKGIDYKIVAETFPNYNENLARLRPTVSGPVITETKE